MTSGWRRWGDARSAPPPRERGDRSSSTCPSKSSRPTSPHSTSTPSSTPPTRACSVPVRETARNKDTIIGRQVRCRMPHIIHFLTNRLFHGFVAIDIAVGAGEHKNCKFHGINPPIRSGNLQQRCWRAASRTSLSDGFPLRHDRSYPVSAP